MIQSHSIPVASLDQIEKAAFFRRTYTHVAYSVLAFIIVEYIFFQIPAVVDFAFSLTQGYRWLILLGGFMFVTNYAEKMALKSHDRNKQYIALLLFVVAEAFIFIPLIGMAMVAAGGEFTILNQAAVLTGSLFLGLSGIALFTKTDFSFLRSILTVGFFIALGLIVAGVLFGFNLGLWFSVGMIALAAGSILYQTSTMANKYTNDQHVAAALGLFASLMLLFWYILSILSRD